MNSKLNIPGLLHLRRAVVSVFATLAVLACSWALLNASFFRGHDYVHAARIAELVRAAGDGHLPVRWSRDFGYGYGMPLFEFYAPLAYYVGGLLYWLGLDVVVSIKALYIISALGSWVGMYYCVSRRSGRVGAVVAATLYTLTPYRALNIFVRGALAEAWGMMWLPWVMYGCWLTWHKTRWGWLVLTVSVAGLALSHNLSLLMFLPLVAIWLLKEFVIENLLVQKVAAQALMKNFWQLVQIGVMTVLGGCLAMFYILPALMEKDFTKIESIFTGYFDFRQHFLYVRQFFMPGWGFGGSNWGPVDGISFFLGFGQLVGLALCIIVLTRWFWRWWQNRGLKVWRSNEPRLVGWIVVSLALATLCLFFSLERSRPIWEAVPFMQSIQFPWRWLGPAHFWLAFAIGLSFGLIRPKLWRLALGWTCTVALLASQWWYFQPESYLTKPSDLYYTDAQLIQTQMSSILPDYIPKQMPNDVTPPTALFLVPAGTESYVEVLVDRTQQKLFHTSLLSPVKMNIQIADFPGWTVYVDGQPVPKLPGQSGTFALDVPAGQHLVGVEFADTPVRKLADAVSLLAAVGLLAGILWTHRGADHPEQKGARV